MRRIAPKGMLAGHYGLGDMTRRSRIASPWIHLGVVSGGLALGYFSHPYVDTPIGATIVGAAGSIVAVGILLLVYDIFREKSVVQAG